MSVGITMTKASYRRIADHHYSVRRILVKALKNNFLTDDARVFLGKPYDNFHDLWVGQSNDKFYDMMTMIRLGSLVELELKNSYMHLSGHKNISQLMSDPEYRNGAFQKILPWQKSKNDGLTLLSNRNFDVNAACCFAKIQEIMIHRHLYAHGSGILDQKYIDDWKKLTGEDITERVRPFPDEDVYFFDPLVRLNEYMECVREFLNDLPSSENT
jgi:hypothetical protein